MMKIIINPAIHFMDEKSTIYFLKTIVFFMPECFERETGKLK